MRMAFDDFLPTGAESTGRKRKRTMLEEDLDFSEDDVTDMEKTDTALGFASQYVLYGRYADHSDRRCPC